MSSRLCHSQETFISPCGNVDRFSPLGLRDFGQQVYLNWVNE